jgi:hypothetical protein
VFEDGSTAPRPASRASANVSIGGDISELLFLEQSPREAFGRLLTSLDRGFDDWPSAVFAFGQRRHGVRHEEAIGDVVCGHTGCAQAVLKVGRRCQPTGHVLATVQAGNALLGRVRVGVGLMRRVAAVGDSRFGGGDEALVIGGGAEAVQIVSAGGSASAASPGALAPGLEGTDQEG